MATNKQNIEIALNSRYNGEGFKKLDGALRGASRGTRQYISSVNQALGGLESFDGVIGKATRSANLFWAAVAGGGVIGAVMSVIGIGIKLWEKYQERIEMVENRIKRLDNVHKAYERRLEIYRQAAIRRAEEAKEAAKREVEAERKRLEGLAQSYERGVVYDKVVRRLNEAERRGSIEKEKDRIRNIEGLQEEAKAQRLATIELRENIKAKLDAAKANVADRQRDVLAAKTRIKAGGDTLQLDIAEKELEIAKVELKNAIAEGKREVAAYRRAIKEKQEAKERELEMSMIEAEREKAIEEEKAKKRELFEKKIAALRLANEKKVEAIEKKIEDAKKEAARLEANAARSRGVSFGDWDRGERNRAKDEEREKSLNDKRIRQAETERDRLADMNPRLMTDWQKERLGKLNTYLLNQDPKNNPALKEVDSLEAEKNQTIKDIKNFVKSIEEHMRKMGII